MVDTGIDGMKIMRASAGDAACEFYADVSDKRLCVLHTAACPDDAERAVAAITGMDGIPLDRMWLADPLPEALAREAGGLFGGGNPGSPAGPGPGIGGSASLGTEGRAGRNPRAAGAPECGGIGAARGGELAEPGRIRAGIGAEGFLAARRGESVQEHLRMVDAARRLYAGVIEGIEECRLGLARRGGGRGIGGEPLHFRFGDPLRDERRFIARLFGSDGPFRLWGLESEIDDGYYSVAGIDLHTWDPVNFEIAGDMMRVYLSEGSCGNTVMRLLCNLQERLGARVRCRQVDELVG